MSPMGGTDGYEALIPSEGDPQKTANAVAEAGLKYFTGRTGNLLPYDEFKQDRPDVSWYTHTKRLSTAKTQT